MANEHAAKPKDKDVVIHVDGTQYKVDKATMSGADIKALVQKDSSYQLFQELQGNDPDLLINDTDSVAIKNGMHFYTVPPATFGESEWAF